ncbi:MAG: hypothetical protein NTZ67_07365 [Gammaproteobacteria bacterium]|nr:hypothetical protein [Gammaproteobacteria bacterium]
MRTKKAELCDVLNETTEILCEQGVILDRTKMVLLELQNYEKKRVAALELQLKKIEIETAALTMKSRMLEKKRGVASTARNSSQFFFKMNEPLSGASFSSFTAVNRSPFK